MATNDLTATIESMAERLAQLADENHALRVRVDQLEGRSGADVDHRPATTIGAAPSSRRQWLARSAAVVAGGAVGAATLGGRAAAANGDTVKVGQSHTGSSTTSITSDVGADIFSAAFGATNSNTTQGTGVFGYGESYGTLGFSANGTGVWGKASGDASTPATGIAGYIDNPSSPGSIAVHGVVSGTGQIGVRGVGGSGHGAWFDSAYVDMRLGDDLRGAPTGDVVAHSKGDVVAQMTASQATLWLCVASGTPGTWRRLAGSTTAGALTFLNAPVRVYDSRPGEVPTGVGPKTFLATSVDRVIDCTQNASGVPTDATGVLLNVTAVNAVANGNLAVRPDGTAVTSTSSLNYGAGRTVANAVTTRVGAGAKVIVRAGGSSGCDVIVDVIGYFR